MPKPFKVPDLMSVTMAFAGMTFAVKKVMNAGLILLFVQSTVYLIRNPKVLIQQGMWLKPVILLTLPMLCTLAYAVAQDSFRMDKFDESLRYALAAPCLYYLHARLTHAHDDVLVGFYGLSWIVIVLSGIFFPGIVPGRFDNQFVDVNTLGMAACIGTFLSAYKIFKCKSSTARLFWLVCCACSGFVLIAAGSRSAWLSAGLCVLFGMLFLPRTSKARVKVIASLALLVAVVFISSETPRERITEATKGLAHWNSEQESDCSSTGVRLDLYKGGLELIEKKPLSGYLLQEEQSAVRGTTAFQQGLAECVKYVWLNSGVHNQYIDRGINQGVIGLLLSLALFWIPAASALRKMASNLSAEQDQSLLLLCSIGLLSFGVHGLFHNIGLKYLCSFHALLIAVYYVKAHQDQSRPQGQ